MNKLESWPMFEVLDRGHEVIEVDYVEACAMHVFLCDPDNGIAEDIRQLTEALSTQINRANQGSATYALVFCIKPPRAP